MSWKLFQHWFNCSPAPNLECVTDKNGEKYWTTWITSYESGVKLHVIYYGNWIGTIDSIWADKGELILADNVIFDRYSYLRGRGVGKAMMRSFIEYAIKHNVLNIEGFIQPHDGSTREYLIEWYKRQGFNVYKTKNGTYNIDMKLNKLR
jgi:GNAT superfamily N-acetyltransferase